MKKTVMIIIGILTGTYALPQTTGLPFQWHGQTMGVDFEATNLTASVKAAIRDDIAYAMSLIPSTNVTFTALTPTASYYGKYAGFITVSGETPINYCEGVLCYYKDIGGGKVFQLDPDACSKYAEKITLTNQYNTAINTFSSYLHSFTSGIDTSNMTFVEKKALLWSPPLLQRLEENHSGTELEKLVEGAVPADPAPPGACPAPSILAFRIETELPTEWRIPLLCCTVKVSRGMKGNDQLLFCYVDGTWRFSP